MKTSTSVPDHHAPAGLAARGGWVVAAAGAFAAGLALTMRLVVGG